MTHAGFLDQLRWIDGRPLRDVIEPYRRALMAQFLDEHDAAGFPRYNLQLSGRGKKNWKSGDQVLTALAVLCEETAGQKQIFTVGFDEDMARNHLDLLRLLIKSNPALKKHLLVKQDEVRRRDGRGFIKVLPGQSALGEHGRTYRLLCIDEIHTQKNWDLLEALQPDPTRREAQVSITSYASLFHKPGVPLFDLCVIGRAGSDPRMLFSWYAADYTTDPAFTDGTPEQRANPSMSSWEDEKYLEQQQRRLPAHKYRRLHLNLPGLPEGSAFQAEPVMAAVVRGVKVRAPERNLTYVAFVDMSGGSNDDAVLCIGRRDAEGVAIIDRIENQGPPPPFNPRPAVARFAMALRGYAIAAVTGDNYAGVTFKADFESHGIVYRLCTKTRSQLYEALEVPLNDHRVALLDVPEVEQQLLGLVWRGAKIDHPSGEHDDWSNAVAGCVDLLLGRRFQCPYCDLAGCSGLHLLGGGPVTPEDRQAVEAVERAYEQARRDAAAQAMQAVLKRDGVWWPE